MSISPQLTRVERPGNSRDRVGAHPRPDWLIESLWAVAAMILAFALAALVLELWRADLRVPIFPVHGDTDLTLASIKGVIEHGWYETNSSLGAPFGQVNHDFPLYIGELGSVIELKFLALFFSHVAVVLNAFVLLGFPLAALSAYGVLRALSFERVIALTGAVLFALAPYHFFRADAHLFLANCYAVPLGAYLILASLGMRPLFARRPDAVRARAWLSRRTLVTLALCLLVGTGGLYYAAFTILLVAAGAVVRALFERNWRPLAAGAGVIAAIGVPVAATAAPELVYRSAHGTNPVVGQRFAWESLRLGLPPIQLVLPIPEHRIAPLARLRADYEQGTRHVGAQGPLPSDSLGIVGTFGLIWLLAGLVAAGLGRPPPNAVRRHAGVAVSLAIALGATAAGGALFAFLVTPQIRAWDRIAILIEFLSLIGTALLLTRAVAALRRRAARLALPALAAIVLVAILDGTSPAVVPAYPSNARTWHADAAFVADIQHTLPPGAMVLELPYVAYPESLGPGGLTSYSLLEPYLHSTTLRWSAGAMAGRPADWLAQASTLPLTRLLDGAVAAGFSGLYVDRRGYGDHGAALAARVQALTRAAPTFDADGHAMFFSLLSYGAQLRAHTPPARLRALADLTLRPPSFGTGFYPISATGGHAYHAARAASEIDLHAEAATRIRVSALLATPVPGSWHVRLELPDGSSRSLPVTSAGIRLGVELAAHPGRNVIRIRTDAPGLRAGGRDVHLNVIDPSFSPSS